MRTLNIFTDASINDTNNPAINTAGCCGFVSATEDTESNNKLKTLDKYYSIQTNTTNNISEATGVLKAVQYAVAQKQNFDNINIFSDSQWCIRSLRTWMFNWITTIDKRGIMYNSNNQPVANQNILAQIVMLIVNNNVKIKFWHCSGHVKDTKGSIFESLKKFRISNHIPNDVHLNYNKMYIISYYNNMIDNDTRNILFQWINSGYRLQIPIDYEMPIFYVLNKDIIERYKNLIS